MEFRASPVTIDSLMSVRKQYVVSRNQREFSWEDEQLQEFWNDLLSNINYDSDNNRFLYSEYFMGAVVLAGNEDGFKLNIVDGQQRLTVTTIFLSALCEKLKELGDDSFARSLYENYIEGSMIGDDDDPSLEIEAPKYFKLEREADSHFFKLAVQNFEKENRTIENFEDQLLSRAYEYFCEKLSNQEIKDLFFGGTADQSQVLRAVKAISLQLTRYLKVIKVVVADEDDAYIIFEILNARGLDLDSADLIKNKIFSDLRRTHPIDYAKDGWNAIKTNLSDRNKNIKMNNFIRQWWSAHYPLVSEGSLYKAFKGKLTKGDYNCDQFMHWLRVDSETYGKIVEPKFDDWRQNDAKKIYYSLLALKIFNVSISRPFILATFEAFSKRKIRHSDLVKMLDDIEKFHFIFNSICSQRASGVENSYSSYARKLLAVSNRGEGKSVLKELTRKLKERCPPEAVFVRKFKELAFTNRSTKDKKLIQYFFFKLERHYRGNDELIPLDMTLEHISPQSNGERNMGLIGNILPLGSQNNNDAGTRSFPEKLVYYSNSNFEVTTRFADSATVIDWNTSEILRRTETLAKEAYRDVWKITI